MVKKTNTGARKKSRTPKGRKRPRGPPKKGRAKIRTPKPLNKSIPLRKMNKMGRTFANCGNDAALLRDVFGATGLQCATERNQLDSTAAQTAAAPRQPCGSSICGPSVTRIKQTKKYSVSPRGIALGVSPTLKEQQQTQGSQLVGSNCCSTKHVKGLHKIFHTKVPCIASQERAEGLNRAKSKRALSLRDKSAQRRDALEEDLKSQLYQKDAIAFGEVVHRPPKLSISLQMRKRVKQNSRGNSQKPSGNQ